ncbi:GNAT family N-acetyltransferase [Saxibacter everestensis]|uniref:GNAT family N-acetyltransferase n=1 Tax=Saxibacter everestensis TaxID=2909229 RepID=A0ABY8QRL0_9MICO|nr:GNAT family N-acetyltransferase [Brevibacteriaceae bacterium ZFBP1038]
MSISIRPATAADYAQVRRITRDAYVKAGYFESDHPYLHVLEDVEHRGQHAVVWVAESLDTIVASVTLTFAGQPYSDIAADGELEFRMLAVDPALQRGGVGRTLVKEIIAYARSLDGIEAVSLTSATNMTRAHTLYSSLGFVRVPERDWYVADEDILLWVFRLPL